MYWFLKVNNFQITCRQECNYDSMRFIYKVLICLCMSFYEQFCTNVFLMAELVCSYICLHTYKEAYVPVKKCFFTATFFLAAVCPFLTQTASFESWSDALLCR